MPDRTYHSEKFDVIELKPHGVATRTFDEEAHIYDIVARPFSTICRCSSSGTVRWIRGEHRKG